MTRMYSIYYLAIFMILSLNHQLSNCLSNYTFTSMDNFNKTIPPVCSLTLQCPGASVQCGNNNMQGSDEECTFNASVLNRTQTFCNGSSTVTVDVSISVAVEEDNDTFDISERQMLTCTPLVSCNDTNEFYNITWEREDFDGINKSVNSSLNGTEVFVDGTGRYTCSVNDTLAVVTYTLYSGPSLTEDSRTIRATINDRVELTCTNHPNSGPRNISFVWLKDNNDSVLLNESNVPYSMYPIGEAKYEDEGVYYCIARSPYNYDSRRFELKVRSNLTPLWPAIGIIIELSLVAIIIFVHEYYKKHQEEKNLKQHGASLDELDEKDDTAAYNFPSHHHSASHSQRHRVDSITKESLLPDSVQ